MVEFHLSELKSLIGKPLKLEELEQVLFDIGMELDSYIIGEDICRIEITPDRTDLISMEGLARALRAYLGIEVGLPKYEILEPRIETIVDSEVIGIRPYIVNAVIRNITLNDDEIKYFMNLQEKFHATYGRNRRKVAIGFYRMELIRPPIYYRAELPSKIRFAPLGFTEEMSGDDIMRMHPKGVEYAFLFENETKLPALVDSTGNYLSIPGIINSNDLGNIQAGTQDIFIDMTGSHLGALKETLNIITTALADRGGKIEPVRLRYPDFELILPDLTPKQKKLDVDYCNEITGLTLSSMDMAELLRRMNYDVEINGKELRVMVLPNRTDVLHPLDIIDDIVRAYTLNKIEPIPPNITTIGQMLGLERLSDKARDIMIGLGFHEVMTLILSNDRDQARLMNIDDYEFVKLEGAKAIEVNIARKWIIPELMKTLRSNRHAAYPQLIFECGDIIILDDKAETNARNERRLAALSAHSNSGFTEIKSIIETVLRNLDVKYSFREAKHPSFISGRVLEV
ncbi:MAG: phenylalanine--tRNA ligase subunit beta, partial [Candidatus Hodarchaeota archaeon]